jgi:hypothetical protein
MFKDAIECYEAIGASLTKAAKKPWDRIVVNATLDGVRVDVRVGYWLALYTSWLAWRALRTRGYSRHASSLSIGTENSQSTSITDYRRVISVVVRAYGPSNVRKSADIGSLTDLCHCASR